jgi:hypothetical protein
MAHGSVYLDDHSAHLFVLVIAIFSFQSHYFDFDDDDCRAETGLAAGTPALLDHVLTHPMTCSLQ